MKGYLFIAWQYLVRHRIKTAILVLSIGLIIFVPVGLEVLVSQSAEELTVRAESTPLVIGAKGSPLELVLNSLYFESDSPEQMRYKEVSRAGDSGLAMPIPLYVRFHSRQHPIVGTTLDYFDDVKTAWIIEGLAHGHRDLASPDASRGVLRREGNKIIANASVRQYTEITEANRQSFHFHGDPSEFPITAIIAVPRDSKSAALLRGRYQSENEMCQIVVPLTIMNELLNTILTVRSFVIAAMATVSIQNLATSAAFSQPSLTAVASVSLISRNSSTFAIKGSYVASTISATS